MIKLLKKAIAKTQVYIEYSCNDRNPQVVEMRLKAEGRLEALEAMLQAARGDKVMLRLMGE